MKSRTLLIVLALIGSTSIAATANAQTGASPDSPAATQSGSTNGPIAQLYLHIDSLYAKRGYIETTAASGGKVKFRECNSGTVKEIDENRLSAVTGECPQPNPDGSGTGTWVAIIDSYNTDGSVTLKSAGEKKWSITAKEWENMISAVPAEQVASWNREGGIVGVFASQDSKTLFPLAPRM